MVGTLRVKDPATGAWTDIATAGPPGVAGPAGEPGEAGPQGPVGGVSVIALVQGTDVVSSATANTMVTLCTTTVHIKPDAWYMLTAGFRAIADLGAAGNCQLEISINGVKVPTHSVAGTSADMGLWGAFGRTWVRQGSAFSATEGDFTMLFKGMVSGVSKTFYSPEMALIELSDPTAPTGAGTWTDATLESGVTGAFQYKVSGGLCAVSYDITRAANLLPTEVIATLPVEARPPAQAYLFGDLGGNMGVRSLVLVDTDGTVRAVTEVKVSGGMRGSGTYGTA